MNTKSMIGTIVTLAVVVICVATIMMPVIGDAQQTATPTTITNTTSIVLREAESGDVLECVSIYDSDSATRTDTWSLNDEVITNLTGPDVSWNVGIMSDGVYMQINASTNLAIGTYYDMTASTPSVKNMTGASSEHPSRTTVFEFGDSSITYTLLLGEEIYTTTSYNYTWGYVVCPYDDGEYCAAVSGGVGYVSEESEIVLCGAYTTGALDTMYYYKDGTTYVSNTNYTMAADIDLELTSGYTDIYTATVSVDMTDGDSTETFTPFRILLPYEVEGHAASGAAYSLYGAIPIIVIAAIVVASIGMVVTRRD